MFNIFWVEVDKISLVTKEHTPAVPKATTKFSFFKFMKPKKKIDMEKIEKLQKRLKWE